MDGTARLTALVEILQRDGRLDVAEMAAEFGISEEAARKICARALRKVGKELNLESLK